MYYVHKTLFVSVFSEINKHGDSNKALRWKKFLKKNKICCTLIRDFRVVLSISMYETLYGNQTKMRLQYVFVQLSIFQFINIIKTCLSRVGYFYVHNVSIEKKINYCTKPIINMLTKIIYPPALCVQMDFTRTLEANAKCNNINHV